MIASAQAAKQWIAQQVFVRRHWSEPRLHVHNEDAVRARYHWVEVELS